MSLERFLRSNEIIIENKTITETRDKILARKHIKNKSNIT